jgi:hypothetical protein
MEDHLTQYFDNSVGSHVNLSMVLPPWETSYLIYDDNSHPPLKLTHGETESDSHVSRSESLTQKGSNLRLLVNKYEN